MTETSEINNNPAALSQAADLGSDPDCGPDCGKEGTSDCQACPKVCRSAGKTTNNGSRPIPTAKCHKCLEHVITVNVVGNVFLVAIKAYLGIVGGSKALFADAIHSLGDLLGSFLMFIALKVANKPKSSDYPYGRGKVEYIAAMLIAGFLAILGVYIFIDAIRDLIGGRYVAPHMVTAWGALISVIVNEIMARQGQCVDTRFNKPSVLAVALESRVDTYSSVAVLAGIVGAKISFPILDSIVAVLVALIILKSAGDMVLESTRRLMDESMDDEKIEKIKTVVSGIAGVAGLGEVRTRELGSKAEVDVVVFVEKSLKVEAFGSIRKSVSDAVRSQLDFDGEISVRLKPFLGAQI